MDTNHLPEAEHVKLSRETQITAVLEGNLVRVMRDEMKPNYLANGPNHKPILKLCMAMAKKPWSKCFCQSVQSTTRPNWTRRIHYAALLGPSACFMWTQ